MLLYHDDLRLAHYLKEWFYRICQNPKYSEQRREFFEWVSTAGQSQLTEFEKYAAAYRHWDKEILNAFKYSHISNGPTEGFNNKIKVLKRTSYSIRNFKHFRTRILLTMRWFHKHKTGTEVFFACHKIWSFISNIKKLLSAVMERHSYECHPNYWLRLLYIWCTFSVPYSDYSINRRKSKNPVILEITRFSIAVR